MNSIQPAIAELERLYRALKPLFRGGIPGRDAVIVIQKTSRTSSSLGESTPHAWEKREGQALGEISIAAEHLARPIEELMATLIHEMVHHCNALRGIADGSDARGYHTRAFRDVAQAAGLNVRCDGRHGWALTSLAAKARAAVLRFKPQNAAFEMFRRPQGSRKAPTKLVKWSCGCTTVRCATQLRARCEECGQAFERG